MTNCQISARLTFDEAVIEPTWVRRFVPPYVTLSTVTAPLRVWTLTTRTRLEPALTVCGKVRLEAAVLGPEFALLTVSTVMAAIAAVAASCTAATVKMARTSGRRFRGCRGASVRDGWVRSVAPAGPKATRRSVSTIQPAKERREGRMRHVDVDSGPLSRICIGARAVCSVCATHGRSSVQSGGGACGCHPRNDFGPQRAECRPAGRPSTIFTVEKSFPTAVRSSADLAAPPKRRTECGAVDPRTPAGRRDLAAMLA